MANFNIIIDKILEHEGVYTDRRTDKGNYVSQKGNWAIGEYPYSSPDSTKLVLIGTCRGITAPELYKYLGRLPSVSEMRNLTEDTVKLMYQKWYWLPIKGDFINSEDLACIILDGAVNHGVGYINRLVQRILGVKVDGKMGPITLAALNKANVLTVFNKIKAARRSFYIQLAKKPGQNEYLKGWLTRIDSFKSSERLGLTTLNKGGSGFNITGVALGIGFFFLVKSYLK